MYKINPFKKVFYLKYLAKMMNFNTGQPQSIKNVKYFDDLTICAAFCRRFPCEMNHRKIVCRKGYYSLELLLNGSVFLTMDDKKLLLEGPCIFWIGDDTESFQYELIPGVSYDHYWIDFCGERGRRIYDCLQQAAPDSHLPLTKVTNILRLFETFAGKFKIARSPVSCAEDVFLVEQLMLEITMQAGRSHTDEQDPYGIRNLLDQIRQAPFANYNLPALAAERGVSYIHFRTLFRQIAGIPMRQFIMEQQMLAAGTLLKSRKFRIGELADYCGFPDITSFTRAFRRYYSKSPKQWLAEQNN